MTVEIFQKGNGNNKTLFLSVRFYVHGANVPKSDGSGGRGFETRFSPEISEPRLRSAGRSSILSDLVKATYTRQQYG
jgi:hypothetical protein